MGLPDQERSSDIIPGISRYGNIYRCILWYLISLRAVNEIGQPWGQMFGGGITKINGKPQLTSAGLISAVLIPNSVCSSSIPVVFRTALRCSRTSPSMLISTTLMVVKFFSLSDFWGTFSGLTARTAELKRRYSHRDPVADGGGVHIFNCRDRYW